MHLPIHLLRHSRFNARKTRTQATIAPVAASIRAHSYSQARPLLVYPVDGGMYEVCGGGIRFEAARLAGIDTVPVLNCVGYTDDEIVQMSDWDNQNDDLHLAVPITDVWAEYARLKRDERWSLDRIAHAKQCDEATVSRRVHYHETLPEITKCAARDGLLTEGHVGAIYSVTCSVAALSTWLTTAQARAELTQQVLKERASETRGNGRESRAKRNPGKQAVSVQDARRLAKEWQGIIQLAGQRAESLPLEWQGRFALLLAGRGCRTRAEIEDAFGTIARHREEEARRAQDELRRQLSTIERERFRLEQDALRAEFARGYTEPILLGDARKLISEAPQGFNLLLTDPPYGISYESGSGEAILNDDESAFELLYEVLATAHARMADNGVVLVFCSPRHEPEFRRAIRDAGFTEMSWISWVKANRGYGNWRTAFAHRHERIIHAVKGEPTLDPPIDDVLYGSEFRETNHPTPKPQDLLRQLILSTTQPGMTIVDPFAGSGSTVLAAIDTGRQYWACEMDERWHQEVIGVVHERAIQLWDSRATGMTSGVSAQSGDDEVAEDEDPG